MTRRHEVWLTVKYWAHCWLFGHRFGPWEPEYDMSILVAEWRYCRVCERPETREWVNRKEVDVSEEELTDEVMEEEEVPAPDMPGLDKDTLVAEAVRRYDRATEHGQKDRDTTFKAFVMTLARTEDAKLQEQISDMQAQADLAFEIAVRAEAEKRLAAVDARGIGPEARKRLLAAKVVNGDYDLAKDEHVTGSE